MAMLILLLMLITSTVYTTGNSNVKKSEIELLLRFNEKENFWNIHVKCHFKFLRIVIEGIGYVEELKKECPTLAYGELPILKKEYEKEKKNSSKMFEKAGEQFYDLGKLIVRIKVLILRPSLGTTSTVSDFEDECKKQVEFTRKNIQEIEKTKSFFKYNFENQNNAILVEIKTLFNSMHTFLVGDSDGAFIGAHTVGFERFVNRLNGYMRQHSHDQKVDLHKFTPQSYYGGSQWFHLKCQYMTLFFDDENLIHRELDLNNDHDFIKCENRPRIVEAKIYEVVQTENRKKTFMAKYAAFKHMFHVFLHYILSILNIRGPRESREIDEIIEICLVAYYLSIQFAENLRDLLEQFFELYKGLNDLLQSALKNGEETEIETSKMEEVYQHVLQMTDAKIMEYQVKINDADATQDHKHHQKVRQMNLSLLEKIRKFLVTDVFEFINWFQHTRKAETGFIATINRLVKRVEFLWRIRSSKYDAFSDLELPSLEMDYEKCLELIDAKRVQIRTHPTEYPEIKLKKFYGVYGVNSENLLESFGEFMHTDLMDMLLGLMYNAFINKIKHIFQGSSRIKEIIKDFLHLGWDLEKQRVRLLSRVKARIELYNDPKYKITRTKDTYYPKYSKESVRMEFEQMQEDLIVLEGIIQKLTNKDDDEKTHEGLRFISIKRQFPFRQHDTSIADILISPSQRILSGQVRTGEHSYDEV